jgi:hypothetical protein
VSSARLGSGEVGAVVQQDGLGPGDEVDRGEHAGQPGLVDREALGREAPQAGVLTASDAVFDAGVGAVPGIEKSGLPYLGVCREAGVAPTVTFLDQVELLAGLRALTAQDDRIPAG